MFKRHNARSENKKSAFGRLARSFVSLSLISVFVLSIAFGVKFLAESSPTSQLASLNDYIPKDSKFGEVAGVLTKKIEENTIEVQEIEQNAEPEEEKTSADATTQETPDDPIKNTSLSINDPPSANMTDDEVIISIFADSHSDSQNVSKAVKLAKESNSTTIIHLGDHTNLGIENDLQKAYTDLASSGMTFYAIPGDRDLWQTSGPENFKSVFGETHYAFNLGESKIVVFDNSMNFSNIPQQDLDWFMSQVSDADFVFLSQPLYHPSNKVMGNFDGEEIVNVKKQASQMLSALRTSKVKAVFAAEHHMSSETPDPENANLMHYVIGALTSIINERPQSILQTPRFSILTIKADGTYSVTEQILK